MARIFAHYVVIQKHKFHIDGWVNLFIDKRCLLLLGKLWNFPLKLVISEVPVGRCTLNISQIIGVLNKMGWYSHYVICVHLSYNRKFCQSN